MYPALSYAVDEPSLAWDNAKRPRSAGLFEIRPPAVSIDALPIYDTDLDTVIGYREEFAGVSHIYALDGSIQISEKPLESPLFDPFDALFIVGGLWRAGLRGFTEWEREA